MATLVIYGPCIRCGQQWSFSDDTLHAEAMLYIDTQEQTFEIVCINNELCKQRQVARAENGDPMPGDSTTGRVHYRSVGQQALHIEISPVSMPGMSEDILRSAPRKTPMCGNPKCHVPPEDHI
jgi:hypothetical protein